jgi:ABC-type polysaccharide/polyol phosphate transport system ATPase subunit
LRADSVTLELPLDLQRASEGEGVAGFKSALRGTSRTYRDVLKNISFSAEEGDRIGVLGLNGAGKTTLLRVLNGAFPPTLGRVERRGSIQSLLNATLGFSEYASVTENVILRGTAMGLRRLQLEAALPGILEFAGLVDRASHRLHTLSSGQRMRLGFAISTAIQPDILLMDEWIATGDAAFIKRAQERLRNRLRGSRIVVLASHSTTLLREMCNKALVLHEGRMHFIGDVAEGIEVYRGLATEADAFSRQSLANLDPLLFSNTIGLIDRVRIGSDGVEVSGWAVSDNGHEVGVLCVEMDGDRRLIEAFERVDRQDVRLHLGRRSGKFGFRLAIAANSDICPDTLPGRMTICAGKNERELGPPLGVINSAIVEYDAATPLSSNS